ncbi:MAG: DUF2750 domain-containing protein [bacterium]
MPSGTGKAKPLNPEELDHVLALNPLTRAEWMLEDCARHEEIWALANAEGWILYQMADCPEGRRPWALPLWPRQELAALCARGAEEQPQRIALDELLGGLLPEMEQRSWQVQSCPWKEEGVIDSAAEFGRQVEEAWDEWTDEDA